MPTSSPTLAKAGIGRRSDRVGGDVIIEVIILEARGGNAGLGCFHDIDIGFKEFAGREGMRLWRAGSLNDSHLLTQALADLVRSRITARQAI